MYPYYTTPTKLQCNSQLGLLVVATNHPPNRLELHCEPILFQNEHFPCGGIIARRQVIETHTARHLLTEPSSAMK